MSNIETGEHCPICRSGRFATRLERIQFQQWTDRGRVRCEVTVLVAVCGQCDYRTWGAEAEAAIEEAVRREYDKLR